MMAKRLSFNLNIAAAIVAAASATSTQSGTIPGAQHGTQQTADVRTYRHCHNTPRRTYCHTRDVNAGARHFHEFNAERRFEGSMSIMTATMKF